MVGWGGVHSWCMVARHHSVSPSSETEVSLSSLSSLGLCIRASHERPAPSSGRPLRGTVRDTRDAASGVCWGVEASASPAEALIRTRHPQTAHVRVHKPPIRLSGGINGQRNRHPLEAFYGQSSAERVFLPA